MSREWVVLTTLIAYKITLIGIGLWAQRRTHDNADYFLGARQLGPLVAAISYAASSSSAWSLLGVSGAAFTIGLGALWLLPGIVTCHAVAWFWIAPRLRVAAARQGAITLTDVLTQGIGGLIAGFGLEYIGFPENARPLETAQSSGHQHHGLAGLEMRGTHPGKRSVCVGRHN